jgi:hypothetical protein
VFVKDFLHRPNFGKHLLGGDGHMPASGFSSFNDCLFV